MYPKEELPTRSGQISNVLAGFLHPVEIGKTLTPQEKR
jgi:hypothetical protein